MTTLLQSDWPRTIFNVGLGTAPPFSLFCVGGAGHETRFHHCMPHLYNAKITGVPFESMMKLFLLLSAVLQFQGQVLLGKFTDFNVEMI